jgi:hypothetical protein
VSKIVDNIVTSNYYIELYSEQTITISSTKNTAGFIQTDENGNLLNSIVHAGSNYIYECVKTYTGNFILYDDVNFVYITSGFTESDIGSHFLMKPTKQMKYILGASKVTNATTSGSKISTNLTGKGIFRVSINGNVLTSSQYTSDSTGITLLPPFNNYITEINDDVVIYTYTIGAPIDNSIVLKYRGVKNLVPTYGAVNTYLSDNCQQICLFNSFNLSEDKTLNKINNIYQYVNFDENVDNNNTISFSMFEDLRTSLRNQRFRIIIWKEDEESFSFFCNCIFQNGTTKNYSMDKNEIAYTFRYEDEIEIIYLGADILYGNGKYGEGYYGGTNYNSVNYEVDFL